MIGENRCCALNDRSCWAIGLWAGLGLLDLAVWSRSLSGAMTAPLSAFLAIGSMIIAMAAAIAALILWRGENRPTGSGSLTTSATQTIDKLARQIWWPEFTTLTLPLAWALVVGWGASPFTLGGLFACWGLLIAATGLVDLWGGKEAEDCELASDRPGGGETKIGDESTQWQKRLVVDGRELIEGETSVDFSAGQKEAVIHLSFCPPLASAPEIHAEDNLGGDLEIRTEAAHPYGARLTVRRCSKADSAESRQLSYCAMLPDAGGTAA